MYRDVYKVDIPGECFTVLYVIHPHLVYNWSLPASHLNTSHPLHSYNNLQKNSILHVAACSRVRAMTMYIALLK